LNLALLHLCDSLFPIGAFGYSDGLEAAAAARLGPETGDRPSDSVAGVRPVPGACLARGWGAGVAASSMTAVVLLDEWIDVLLDESIGRLEGPAVWHAWIAVIASDGSALAALDEELTAIRPASAARAASRAMGHRLLTTWSALHPDERLARVPSPCSLPVAFAAACACSAVQRREAVEAYAYTRLASTVSAAMRMLPLGQTEAHTTLARALERVPSVARGIAARGPRIESFSPALDIAAMSQQYLESRLFRS